VGYKGSSSVWASVAAVSFYIVTANLKCPKADGVACPRFDGYNDRILGKEKG